MYIMEPFVKNIIQFYKDRIRKNLQNIKTNNQLASNPGKKFEHSQHLYSENKLMLQENLELINLQLAIVTYCEEIKKKNGKVKEEELICFLQSHYSLNA